eukprot:3769076-Rhodomonas_salina.1
MSSALEEAQKWDLKWTTFIFRNLGLGRNAESKKSDDVQNAAALAKNDKMTFMFWEAVSFTGDGAFWFGLLPASYLLWNKGDYMAFTQPKPALILACLVRPGFSFSACSSFTFSVSSSPPSPFHPPLPLPRRASLPPPLQLGENVLHTGTLPFPLALLLEGVATTPAGADACLQHLTCTSQRAALTRSCERCSDGDVRYSHGPDKFSFPSGHATRSWSGTCALRGFLVLVAEVLGTDCEYETDDGNSGTDGGYGGTDGGYGGTDG